MSVSLKWNIMKIWAVFLLYVPCSSPFAILSLKTVVEYATSDNGAVIESIAGSLMASKLERDLQLDIYLVTRFGYCFGTDAVGLTFRCAYADLYDNCSFTSFVFSDICTHTQFD
ncbi:hypothetical protein V6N13_058046 [Hibiscus sabdariffa]|uniref:Uncharacterized protein n=1 Tax=Hibiscus sabdariffa TaxID=183260 RepID=A0ABR2GI09_9ROSI